MMVGLCIWACVHFSVFASVLLGIVVQRMSPETDLPINLKT